MNILSNEMELENRIFKIRNQQVMVDRDIAELYQVEVKRLNEQVKRNLERFPLQFRFQLNKEETLKLVANCDRLKILKHSSSNPYVLTSRIIRSAKKSILLIDNYIDESTLTHLSKKEKNVGVTLLSKDKSAQLDLDLKKAIAQYGNFAWQQFDKSHDRFLIIDQNEVYHLGASLKDLGKKWFAFSKLDKLSVESMLKSISELI